MNIPPITKTISDILDEIIGVEGGYSNHSSDLGGETMWGITRRVARAHGYEGDMKSLSKVQAKEIYYSSYVLAPKYHTIETISSRIMKLLIDIEVNMGPIWGVKWMQRTLNLTLPLDRQLEVDGKLGPKTVDSLRELILKRGPQGIDFVLKGINICRGQRYFDITEIRPDNKAFIVGWINSRINL